MVSSKLHIEEQFAATLTVAVSLGIRPITVVLTSLSLNNQIRIQDSKAFFTTPACTLELEVNTQEQQWCQEISLTHSVGDMTKLRHLIIHDFSSFLPDNKRSSFGKYYTPAKLTALARQTTEDLDFATILVVDLAAGCGAFIKEFTADQIKAFDIDEDAVLILKALGFAGERKNSLAETGRAWFNIDPDVKLVLVGNPPYNDVTSKNKRTGNNTKINAKLPIHPDLKTSDLGRSFLKQAFTLEPIRIVFLHPFSYICKRKNLKELCGTNYRVTSGTLFSSSLFPGTSTPFPCICAVWEPCPQRTDINTEWERIRQIKFKLINGGTFSLAKYAEFTIEELPKYASNATSDCGVYHYNFRDLNSLLTSANFVAQTSASSFPVQWEKFPALCLANTLKRRWRSVANPLDFIAGNLNVPRCPALEGSPALLMADTLLNSPVLRNNPALALKLKDVFAVAARNSEQWAIYLLNGDLDKAKLLVSEHILTKLKEDKRELFE